MTDRTRVGGAGGNSPASVADSTAEDGFQKALGQSTVTPAPVTGLRQGLYPRPKAPPQQVPKADAKAPLPTAQRPAEKQPAQKQPETKPLATPTSDPTAAGTTPEPGRFSSLGDRLVDMRKSLGITQVELARRMGSTQPAMARIEKGEMKPNLRTLARYGEAIGQRVQVAFNPAAGKFAPFEKVAERVPVLDKVAIDDVPDALGQVRRQLGLTQAQVATAMETSQPVIARLENGEAVPNLRTLERYCEAIGVEPSITFVAITETAAS